MDFFAAKTVSALWHLEIISLCDTLAGNAEVSRYLAHQQAEIEIAFREGRQYNLAFAQSDVWQLKEQIYTAALDGEDLIAQIQRRIENQIVALQQYFARPLEFKATTEASS